MDNRRAVTEPDGDSEHTPAPRSQDRSTFNTIPVEEKDQWTPPPKPSGAARFRPVSGDKTVMVKGEASPQLPLAWLVIVEGPGGERGTLLMLKTETLVGRKTGDFLLSGDRTVSSQHIRIRLEPREDGEPAFVLYDQTSSNGTFVGTRQTYRNEESRMHRHELQDGDYLLVGETTLVFKQVDE